MRFVALIVLIFCSGLCVADDDSLALKLKDAMASDIRTADEIARDENRRPVETLQFFQIRDDMRVLELLPGGGWYTKLLAPVLREKGELYVALGTDGLRDGLLKDKRFSHVKVLESGASMVRDGEFGTRNVAPFDLGVRNLDLAVTFRNMHNFTPAGRASVNAAVFAALRPGGLYGVIDHSRRHMEPMSMETRRRSDVVEIIVETQAAGFVLVDNSDLHFRPDDELRYEVGRKTVTGNTDRFTLLFRKP